MLPYHGKLLSAVNKGGYQPRAVTFDGATRLRKNTVFSDTTNNKRGIVSFWIKVNTAIEQHLYQQYINFIFIGSAGSLNFSMRNADGSPSTAMAMSTSNEVIGVGSWQHVLAAWDVGIGARHLYVDDQTVSFSGTIANSNIDYTSAFQTHVSGDLNDSPNQNLFADLSQYYFNQNEYLDLTVVANRRKFIKANGLPVNLGSDGSIPTGNDPAMFLNLDNGAAVSTFANNKGFGGGFTVINGTLTEAATKPEL